jgi:hypothetical protein
MCRWAGCATSALPEPHRNSRNGPLRAYLSERLVSAVAKSQLEIPTRGDALPHSGQTSEAPRPIKRAVEGSGIAEADKEGWLRGRPSSWLHLSVKPFGPTDSLCIRRGHSFASSSSYWDRGKLPESSCSAFSAIS